MTMPFMTNDSDIFEYLNQRDPRWGMPREFYNSERIYQLDLAHIWYQSWVFVAHTIELESIDSQLSLTLGDYQIVLCKKGDGQIAALGTNVKSQQQKSIACETVCGYVFINLADEPSSFSTFAETVKPYLQSHNIENLKVAHESSIVEYGNWKLVFENNRECYHCLSNHPELTITYPELPTITGTSLEGGVPEMVESHWNDCEKAGFPSRFYISEDGRYRVSRMPLLQDFTSFTMDGADAVNKRLNEQFDNQNLGTLLLFHYPNTWNHILADHVLSFRLLPISPQSSLVTTKWLVHRDAKEGVDYHLDRLTHVWNQTNAQDKQLVEQNQLGINSPLYEPGPYSTVYEDGVIQFVNWYSNTLKHQLNHAISTEASS